MIRSDGNIEKELDLSSKVQDRIDEAKKSENRIGLDEAKKEFL